jgi:hypothetical protein
MGPQWLLLLVLLLWLSVLDTVDQLSQDNNEVASLLCPVVDMLLVL